jgi:hypothetical protein
MAKYTDAELFSMQYIPKTCSVTTELGFCPLSSSKDQLDWLKEQNQMKSLLLKYVQYCLFMSYNVIYSYHLQIA